MLSITDTKSTHTIYYFILKMMTCLKGSTCECLHPVFEVELFYVV